MFNKNRHTGHRQKTIDRIHLVVRLELGNPLLTPSDLAKLLGITYSSFIRLKTLPQYKQVHNQYFSGVLTRLDTQVDNNLSLTQETLKFAVPMAMQNLLKQALQEKDLRVQNKACNDLLDRDGHFAKVKRIGLATPEQGGVSVDEKDNDVARGLIEALAKSKTPNIQASTQNGPSINDPSITNKTQ